MFIIKLKASDLAKLTRHNTYEDINDIIRKILNDNHIVKHDISQTHTESNLKKLSKKEFSDIKLALQLSESNDYTDVDNKIKQLTHSSTNTNISENTSKKIIDTTIDNIPELQILKPYINSDISIQRGIRKEHTNLNTIESKRQLKIDHRNATLYNKILYRDNAHNYEVLIRGKIDGITQINNEEYIVETKNRHNRLFFKIPDYELVQLEAYMFLHGCHKCLHIEHYDQASNEIYYDHNPEFWDECTQKIKLFIDTYILQYL